MRVRIESLFDKHEADVWDGYSSNERLLSYGIPGLIEEQTSSYLEETDWGEDGEPTTYEAKPIYSYFIDFTSPEQLFEITRLTKSRLIFTSYNKENGFITIYDDWSE